MFKRVLAISAAFIITISSFVIPSFADSDFSGQPFIVGSESNGVLNFYSSNVVGLYNNSINIVFGTLFDDTYAFTYNNGFYVVWDSNFVRPNFGLGLQSNNSWTAQDARTSSYSDTYSLRYVNLYSYQSPWTFYVPDFQSIDEGLAAVRDYIENPPSSDPIYDDLPNFNIQRGYAAYIDFGSDWSSRSISGTFTSSFPQYSSLISGDWDGTDNRRYFWTDSLPSNTNFTSNVGNAIDWTKVPPYDLLQRSKNGIWFIQSNSPLNRYLVIVNPNQWRYGQNPTDDTINSPITVSDLSGSTGDVKFFALNQKFDSDGTLVSSTSDNASNNRTGTYDPDTGQWEMTDSNGNSADQVPGGESDTPVISSISDYIHNITNVLTNFANSVISLIQAPISHISELIDAGSDFMSSLRGMYAWLPVDIQGLIIAALTVVIGIGVFKVFL